MYKTEKGNPNGTLEQYEGIKIMCGYLKKLGMQNLNYWLYDMGCFSMELSGEEKVIL